jgi:hypothetical protein
VDDEYRDPCQEGDLLSWIDGRTEHKSRSTRTEVTTALSPMDRGVRSMLRDVIAEVKVWQLIEPSSSQYQMQSSNAVQRENGGKRTNEVRWLERQLPLLRRCILSSKADELTGGQHRGRGSRL